MGESFGVRGKRKTLTRINQAFSSSFVLRLLEGGGKAGAGVCRAVILSFSLTVVSAAGSGWGKTLGY